MLKRTLPFIMTSVIAISSIFAIGGIAQARGGADDGPSHDAGDDHDDHGGHGKDDTATPATTSTPSRGGDDDGPNHDANDDHGSRRDDGPATSTATGDNGGSRGTPSTTAAQSAARPVRSMFLARLAGAIDFLHAKGKAKLVSSSSASQLEIEIENIGRLAGTRVDFFVDGRKVGSDTVSSLGTAEVRVTGPGIISPAGKCVTVQTTAGLLIAAGNFE